MSQSDYGDLSDREVAVSTIGIDYALETCAAAATSAAAMARLYDYPPTLTFAQYRETVHFGEPTFAADATDSEVDSVPVRVFGPSGTPARGRYLHLHGGGWCLGSHRGQDARLQSLADATSLEVISVGYRLAPEHVFPSCLDDVLAVASALSAEPGFLAIGGESAGAHLAALAMTSLRDRSGECPFDAAVLTYGAFDLGAPRLDKAVSMLAPGADRTARRDAGLSPMFADLDGLPPARFVVGTRDHLIDQTVMLHARWRLVAHAELDIVAGAAHAFTASPIAAATQAQHREEQFLSGEAERFSTPAAASA